MLSDSVKSVRLEEVAREDGGDDRISGNGRKQTRGARGGEGGRLRISLPDATRLPLSPNCPRCRTSLWGEMGNHENHARRSGQYGVRRGG